MPIPKRKAGEPRDEFISRCIADLSGEYPTNQASAICYQQLHDSFYDEDINKKQEGEKDAL